MSGSEFGREKVVCSVCSPAAKSLKGDSPIIGSMFPKISR